MIEAPREYHEVAREDGVHVLSDMCETCVFRPGNLMGLPPGRLKGMIEGAKSDASCIPCHSTIRRDDVQPAICHGFWIRYARDIISLRLAVFLNVIVFDGPPRKEI
jgi:hypothetical protein